jgi:hypothetical protein
LRGSAVVTSESSSRCDAAAISWTARWNASSFACDGFVVPLILRVLERGRLDLLGRRGGLEVVERPDVPAHAAILAALIRVGFHVSAAARAA